MKTPFLAIGILSLCCSIAFSQSPAEVTVLGQLRNGPDVTGTLETVLEKSDEYSALVLFESAHLAFQKNRLEDSAFLFYIAQLRFRFDLDCFPPMGKGGNSPFQYYAVLSNDIGMVVNPAIAAEPKVFEKVLQRMKQWMPKASKDYDPGYEFLERKSVEDATKAANPNRRKFIIGMQEQSTLLNDAEYFAAFQILQAYNLGPEYKRPTIDSYKEATETIRRIEKDKAVDGVGTFRSTERFSTTTSPAEAQTDSLADAVEEGLESHSHIEDSRTQALLRASGKGDVCALQFLLEDKVDVNATGKHGHSALLASIFFEQKECFDFLLANGADPNQQSNLGDSPISIAANKKLGNEYWLKSILENGGNPNLVDDKVDHESAQFGFSNTTPIFDALRAMNVNNVELLIDAGASIHWKDDSGDSLLAIAADIHQFDIVFVLLKHGANYEGKSVNGKPIKEFLGSVAKETLTPKQKKNLIRALKLIEAGAVSKE